MAALAQKAMEAKRKFGLLNGVPVPIRGIGVARETPAVHAPANPHKV